jgi:hypothetical protein
MDWHIMLINRKGNSHLLLEVHLGPFMIHLRRMYKVRRMTSRSTRLVTVT